VPQRDVGEAYATGRRQGAGPRGARQQGELLRIAITGGGCNGLSYKMKFAREPRGAISSCGPRMSTRRLSENRALT